MARNPQRLRPTDQGRGDDQRTGANGGSNLQRLWPLELRLQRDYLLGKCRGGERRVASRLRASAKWPGIACGGSNRACRMRDPARVRTAGVLAADRSYRGKFEPPGTAELRLLVLKPAPAFTPM